MVKSYILQRSQLWLSCHLCLVATLLFLLYVDDINHCLAHSSVQMIADNFALYKEITSPSDQEQLQAHLNCVYMWSCK